MACARPPRLLGRRGRLLRRLLSGRLLRGWRAFPRLREQVERQDGENHQDGHRDRAPPEDPPVVAVVASGLCLSMSSHGRSFYPIDERYPPRLQPLRQTGTQAPVPKSQKNLRDDRLWRRPPAPEPCERVPTARRLDARSVEGLAREIPRSLGFRRCGRHPQPCRSMHGEFG